MVCSNSGKETVCGTALNIVHHAQYQGHEPRGSESAFDQWDEFKERPIFDIGTLEQRGTTQLHPYLTIWISIATAGLAARASRYYVQNTALSTERIAPESALFFFRRAAQGGFSSLPYGWAYTIPNSLGTAIESTRSRHRF